MNILLISNSCDTVTYKQIQNFNEKSQISPVQHFFKMVTDGLADDKNNKVISLSIPQISKRSMGISDWKSKRVKISDNLEYIYPDFHCGRLIKPYSQRCSAAKICKEWMNDNPPENSIVIVDLILYPITAKTVSLCHSRGYKVICILTDMPDAWTAMNKSAMKGIRYIFITQSNIRSTKNLSKYDGYVFLTEQMNEKANPHGMPYIVMEGCADIANKDRKNDLGKKDIPRVVMYAGGVYDVFGITSFTEAFIKADVEGYEFHVYGKGNCTSKIEEIEKIHPCVKYCGLLPREDIVDREIAATLLVNPRPPKGEYTKYSFPSKTMEYMSTGTPVLSTRLPGIPSEYGDFLFWFDSTDVASMAKTIKDVLSHEPEYLHEFGLMGKEFVISRKNNKYQAKRIANMCRKILNIPNNEDK